MMLLQTAPDADPGSMRAYGDLVEQAVRTRAGSSISVERMRLFSPSAGASMWVHHRWRCWHAHRVLSKHDGLFHLLDGSMAAFVPSVYWPRLLVTVHDLIPWRLWKGLLPGPRPSWPARWIIRRSLTVLKNCRGLVADSEATRRDVAMLTGRQDVEVIPLALRPLAKPCDEHVFTGSFMLHVGNNAAYKNRHGVLEVFARLQVLEDLHLVMAGPSPDPGMRAMAGQLKRVIWMTNPDDSTLASLYQQARLLLFPSLFEGFGMPVLEAMSSGCPVVCSNAGSLPEVAGDAALAADAHDTVQLAALCRRVLQDKPLRDDLINRGRRRASCFSLEKMGEMLCEWYYRQR